MKVKIGPFKNWIGPYHIAEILLFWVPKYKNNNRFEYSEAYDRYVNRLGEWLAEDKNGNESLLTKLCLWIESKRERKIKIKIDPWDTWSMDSTLALIVLPMLKQLKETNHGYHNVDLEDVPVELRSITHEEYDDQLYFDWYHDKQFEDLGSARWDWVMNEMIWTFEQIVNDDDFAQFITGFDSFDSDNFKKHHERIDRGLLLFGKYYRGLWD